MNGSTSTYPTDDSITLDGTVPSSTPAEVFQTERYGDQQWDFDVTSGQQYEVRLYFAEIYQESSNERIFDVAIEGETVLNDYDIYADVGHDVGTMKSFTVTPTEGTLDVDFTTEVNNAKISAVEIVEAEPQPDTLGASPSSVDFGSVVVGDSESETVTVTNLGGDGDPNITLEGLSVSGDDAFSAGSASQSTLAPGESADIPVTFAPSGVDSLNATLEISHSGSNSPLTVDLSGEGASSVDPAFEKSELEGFSAGNPTAIDFGPDGRAYVSTQSGTVYALNVTRTGDNSYEVTNEVQIDAIKDIPNHDDFGNIDSSEDNRQITGLTVGGTADQPVVYVSSSDPEIDVGQDDDDTDTNSGAISRLTVTPGSDGTLQASEIDHDVMVLGLPRSEENHATNGIDLSADGDTLYVAQGGHTNKGAPGDNFGHTPEYALSAAILEIDLAQIENDYQAKSLQTHNSEYPDLDYLYAIPTIQGGDLPFGGNDGINQAKIVEGGPVQVYSPGYRNPYDLVVTESGQIYAADHGPNGGWGGQPADADGNIVADASSVTNHPNEDGSYTTSDQLIEVDEGEYGGHAAPIRANPTGADIYDADGDLRFDINESNSPVPSSQVNPIEADYIPPTSGSPDPGAPAGSANTMEYENGDKVLFGPTGGTTEYTASNFNGSMETDLLQVELYGSIKRVELSDDGATVTNVETIANTDGPLGITAQDDDEKLPGTVWIANHGGNDVTVLEPVDYGTDGGDDGQICDPDDLDPDGDADGDGYTNGDELTVGTDPCSSASTPADFDDDGDPNALDPDDDNDGVDDTEDPFAVGPNNGLDTTLPVQHDLSELSLFGEHGQGWTGVMTNGTDYQALYNTSEMTVGGAAEVLTVEEVPPGDAYSTTNTQQYAFQFGADTPDEPFTVETTVAAYPENPENYQSAGLFVGTGDQSNYVKLVVAADGGNGGIEFAKEVDDTFTHPTSPNVVSDSAVKGNDTTLTLTVDPTTDPAPDNGVDEVAVTANYTVDGETTEVGTAAMPASWLDTSDGTAPAFGVIATSNGASPFPATWTHYSLEYVTPPENQPPVADAGADQTVDEGQQVTLDGSGSTDPDGDDSGLDYAWTQTAGPDVTLSDASSATPTFTAPEVDGDATLTFQVEVSDGETSDTDTVNVTVQDTDVAAGQALHRVNAGGAELAALDDGPDWGADTDAAPSQYLVDPNGSSPYSDGDEVTPTDDVPDSTPDAVFDAERYDVPDDGIPMEWEFPVEDGQQVDVRLYFGNQYPDTSEEEQREFNVSIEGQQVLTNYDPVADVGHANGTMKNFTVTSDGTIDVDFEHGAIQNPQVNAIEVVAVEDQTEELTVAEAIAAGGDDDSLIEDSEIQQAINYWATDSEVPGTGGETVSDSQIQQLINYWATGTPVADDNEPPTAAFTVSPDSPEAGQQVSFDASGSSDADGSIASYEWDFDDGGTATGEQVTNTFDAAGAYDVTLTVTDDDGATDSTTETVTVGEPTAQPGAASVSVTPDSGTEASTYSGGSFTIENTGDQQISSVTFDLSSGAMPDMVWDPEGTAGDGAAKGLSIDSESGDGVGVVSTADDDVFSQPHNGVNGSDGYDVLTIEFTHFEPGESVSFSADNDPTSIKNASISSQEAGPVSGLELARSNVSVEYADGSAQATQLFGDGSAGGAQATLGESIAPAPKIGVQGVTLDDGALRDHHSAATVSGANQTVTVTGAPGETVTLLHFEAELELDNVPEYDGTPGYDIEAYEANKIENVDYQTVTLDANGEAEVPVTLLNTTDVGGYNHFVATHGEPGSDTGLDSNVVVLKYEASAGDGDTTSYAVNAGGSDYTAADGTTYVADTGFGGEFSGSAGTSDTTEDIGNTQDDPLYQTERYGDPLSYSMPVEDGTYEVTLQFAEIWHGDGLGGDGDDDGDGDGEVGDRVFNVSVEDEQVLTDYDIYADVGALNATEKTFTVEVTDGELNFTLEASEDYGKLSAFTVSKADSADGNTAPTIEAIANQTVTEGNSTTVAVSANDPDGDSVSLSVTGPDFVTLDGDTITIAPESGDAGTYTVDVTADDGTDQTTESFEVTVEAAETQVLYRVNAGESTTLSATDAGPDWTGVADTGSQYLASVGSGGGNYCGGTITSTTSAVPSSTPGAVYDCERYGNSTWTFDVTSGTDVEVRLYVGNQFNGTSEPGNRTYNVSIEGQQVLTQYDPVADVGHETGTMKNFTVTEDGDGTITVEFEKGAVENPQVNAIEIVEAEESDS